MFEIKNSTESPFQIVLNYRSTSTRSSKISARQTLRKMSDVRMDINPKKLKQRKMTQNIEVQNMLREHDIEVEARYAHSEAAVQPQKMVNELYDIQNCELEELGSPDDLQKMIPVNLREEQLDEESPLEMGSFRNLCHFEQEVYNKSL